MKYKIRDINNTKTVFTKSQMEEYIRHNTQGAHESILRAYQILEEVKTMLKRGDSKETIIWIIDELEYKAQNPPCTTTSN